MTVRAVNPATGEQIAGYPATPPNALNDIAHKARLAQRLWAGHEPSKRATHLHTCAQLLKDRKNGLAELMAREMGKPIKEGRGEIEKCAWVCEHYADHAESYLAPETVETDNYRSYVCYRPIGIVLAIMPWNFPFWQVFRCLAPSLMAGNGVLLKHASNVPGCSLAIQELVHSAGVPQDLFRSLLIGSHEIPQLLEHPAVQAVTLTGSTPAGRSVAETAGKHLKKVVLELGGSDPYLVLEDADLEKAADVCVRSRMQNCGQSCIAAKRFIVVPEVRERFEQLMMKKFADLKVGNPLDPSTEIGPMARLDLRDELQEQVEKSLAAGARRLVGGPPPDRQGSFFTPTLLTDVSPGMPAYDEELFGPVAAILPAGNEEDAIRIANDSSFGLGAAVFTEDVERGERIAADRLHAGSCFVNKMVGSDPRLPFGGIKDSGYGRELAGHGIRELVNVKTVVIA